MSPNNNISNLELKKIIRRFSFWYRLRRSIDALQKGFLVGLSVGLGFAFVVVTTVLGDHIGLGKLEFSQLLIIVSLIGGLSLGLLNYFWPASAYNVARFFDTHFKLEDRTSTAIELISMQTESTHQVSEIENKQIEDAVYHGNRIQPHFNFFFSFSRLYLFSIFIVSALIITLSFLGKPYFDYFNYKQAVRQAVQEEILGLEELQEKIYQNELLSPEDKEELGQLIQETIQDLDQTETLEQALAALTQTEEKLKSLNDPEISNQVQSLKQLGNQLQQTQEDSNNVLKDFAEKLNSGELSSAAESLKDINLKDLSADETEALQDQLSDAAEHVSESLPGLSEELNKAAEALENGNLDAAQEALSKGSEEVAKTGYQKAKAVAVEQTATQVDQSTNQLLQSELSQLAQSGSGQPNSSSQNPSENSQEINSGKNQGSSDQTSGGNGSGSGKGTDNLGEAVGSEAGDNPIDQGNGPGDGGEVIFEPLTNPKLLGGNGSTDIYLPESSAPGEEILGLENTSQGEPGSANVPYIQVFPSYAETYRQVVESGTIPTSLRNLVRDYFNNLEP